MLLLVQGLFAAETDIKIPETVSKLTSNLPLLGAVAGGLLVLLVLLFLFRGGKKKVDPEENLGEDLSAIGPAPKGPRHYQLYVMNQPVRLRLVVIAPMGKKVVGKIDTALEQIFRGLGEVAIDDKPRVRLWPPQLSAAGFAPSFFRLTKRPDPDGKASKWILLAGPARAGSMPVLLGLAVQADELTKTGLVTMTETKWGEVLRVENA
jgi:hypothetical protein